MRTDSLVRTVSTHGVGDVAPFRIKNSGKAFKVLIDGLYSDKIRAVVREIWSNAYDAHVEAACSEQPFECQLPTIFEPIFRVRDYGIGMDHQTIMHLYTTVFESTKENTNTQVGKFGLGSKAPFAYTDTFTVTSYSGTDKTLYSAYIGDGYEPMIATMGREACDEPRGIEIQFPVNSNDAQAFRTAAEATIQGFDTMPTILGQSLRVEHLPVDIEGDGWKVIRRNHLPMDQAYAKQGCVIYPINGDAVDQLSSFELALLMSPIVIDFEVGELEISASRESLGYDTPTKANIRARLQVIAEEIVEKYRHLIAAAGTYSEARTLFDEVTESGLSHAVVKVLKAKLTYRGKSLDSVISLTNVLFRANQHTLENGGLRAMRINKDDLERGRAYKGRRTKLQFTAATTMSAFGINNVIVIVDDVDHPGSMFQDRLRYWWDTLDDSKRKNVLFVKTKMGTMHLKRVLVMLGKPEFLRFVDLPKPPADATGYSRRTITKVKEFVHGEWEDTEIVVEDAVVFVEMFRGDALDEQRNATTNHKVEAVSGYLRQLGYIAKDQVVIGIPQTHKSKLKANGHWINLWALASQALVEKYDAYRAGLARGYEDLMFRPGPVKLLMMAILENPDAAPFKNAGPAKTSLAMWTVIKNQNRHHVHDNAARKLYETMGGQSPKTIIPLTDGSNEAFLEAYPMADYVLKDSIRSYSTVPVKLVVDYVNLVDGCCEKDESVLTENSAESF